MRDIRVFVADDHAVVRMGIRHVLRELGGFRVVGEARHGREVLRSEALASCDVLILDLSLPELGGVEVLQRLRKTYPTMGVVVHSMYPADQFARRAIEAGATSYVGKDRPPGELVDAVRAAALNRYPREMPSVPAEKRPHESLTSREHQVFMLLLEGRTVAEVAAEMDVHSSTVSNHLAKIRKKLGVRTIADVVQYAYVEGLRTLPS